jgi:hypothetical protein
MTGSKSLSWVSVFGFIFAITSRVIGWRMY